MPDETRSFQISVDKTERLDRFLADQLDLSRTQAARIVALGGVAVNGQRGRPSRCLTRGDSVEVRIPPEEPVRQIRPHRINLDVIHEDSEIIVLDKPAGLVVHPAPGHWDDTLVNALVARGTGLSQLSKERPGIVHRLDRDTSGLLIVAKTSLSHRRLARAIATHHVERTYAALSWGHVKADRKIIDAPIARHPGDRKRMTVIATGRTARTTVHRVARFDDCDLLRVSLETGRTHQIRVHLAHIGHPIVGDSVYGGGGSKRVDPSRRPQAGRLEALIPRQALHATVLRFQHPMTRETATYRAPWPADLLPGLRYLLGEDVSVDRFSVLEYLGFFQ